MNNNIYKGLDLEESDSLKRRVFNIACEYGYNLDNIKNKNIDYNKLCRKTKCNINNNSVKDNK